MVKITNTFLNSDKSCQISKIFNNISAFCGYAASLAVLFIIYFVSDFLFAVRKRKSKNLFLGWSGMGHSTGYKRITLAPKRPSLLRMHSSRTSSKGPSLNFVSSVHKHATNSVLIFDTDFVFNTYKTIRNSIFVCRYHIILLLLNYK